MSLERGGETSEEKVVGAPEYKQATKLKEDGERLFREAMRVGRDRNPIASDRVCVRHGLKALEMAVLLAKAEVGE